MRTYVAGPFFNTESRKVLQQILDLLEELGHEVWAPMRDGITCPKDASREERHEVFMLDCEKIRWAKCIVALLDYPLPPYQQLLLREKTSEGISKDIPIHLPDPGTVFEIGYATALNNRYIIGYATSKSGFNLMLSEACDCIVHDILTLKRAMELVTKDDKNGLELLKIQYQNQKRLMEI